AVHLPHRGISMKTAKIHVLALAGCLTVLALVAVSHTASAQCVPDTPGGGMVACNDMMKVSAPKTGPVATVFSVPPIDFVHNPLLFAASWIGSQPRLAATRAALATRRVPTTSRDARIEPRYSW